VIARSTLRVRLLQAAEALGVETGGVPQTLDATLTVLATRLNEPSARASYLLLAVTAGRIPLASEVVELEREWRLTGSARMLAAVLAAARSANRLRLAASPVIRVESGIIVDVHDTAHSPFTTGIQRVTRSVLTAWADHPTVLVAWSPGYGAPRSLSRRERLLALGVEGAAARAEIVIPFGATWVLPEIAVEATRAARIRSIALHSGSRTVAIGHDCIPITSAETAGQKMPGSFARYLSALAEFDVIASTSSSSRAEFEGWRTMLGGAGIAGPDIRPVLLPTSTTPPPIGAASLVDLGIADGATVVLAVGSHEPRKNHLALVQAAELAWRSGLEFTLVLVGGNSWGREAFDAAVAAARADGRALVTVAGASDAVVWSLYRRASFTVFPSLNEGFGLPVVESISAGTPVITSDFGSMRESAKGYGGLLIDPRNDTDLAGAMRQLLTDDALLARLEKQTQRAPRRSWAQYATELWSAFGLETT
jgi:glycosyltransferase involved in cell wall biosynthesis